MPQQRPVSTLLYSEAPCLRLGEDRDGGGSPTGVNLVASPRHSMPFQAWESLLPGVA